MICRRRNDVTTANAVVSGQGLLIGNLFGICIGAAAAGANVNMRTCGVFDIAKNAGDTFAVGDKVFWNAATLIGAVTVNAIGDPKAYGLDAAIAAGLFALVWPQIAGRQTALVAMGGASVALVLVLHP